MVVPALGDRVAHNKRKHGAKCAADGQDQQHKAAAPAGGTATADASTATLGLLVSPAANDAAATAAPAPALAAGAAPASSGATGPSPTPIGEAAATVPGGPSVACSTPTAIAWDASFAANADPSGRAVTGVHRGA
ncbi:MAG: hypothetical protein FJ100_10400 [Deltaproteobacteria bacterium]|nr:hypothetical protein [Deltaproteobacteria bacterium]